MVLQQQILPGNVLQAQICSECFQYLSVFPTVLNKKGEKICGRCIESEGEDYTESIYNTVVNSGFLFRCINYLDGCDKILSYAEVKEHEKTCICEPRNCFFCSFSGNLMQIFNHSLKVHSENVSLQAIIQFSLPVSSLEKTLLLAIQENTIVLASLSIAKGLLKIVFKLISKTPPGTISHYALKIFKSKDRTDNNFSVNDYGLLNMNFENSYERPLEDLVAVFSDAISLNCQISVNNFMLKEDQLEFQNRMYALQNFEHEMVIFKKELQSKDMYLSEQINSHKSMIEVFKVICPKIFTCVTCKKLTLDVYYCQELHFYCMDCLSVFCNLCNSVMKFERFSDLDQILVPCIWMGCVRKCSIEDFLNHKRQCVWRPFKCPLNKCTEVLLSKEKFIKHWHSDTITLLFEDTVTMTDSCKAKEFYWFLSNYDLYRVVIHFQTFIQVLIEKVNVLDNVLFGCEGFANNSWHKLEVSKFCDLWQVNKESKFTFNTPTSELSFNTTQITSYSQLKLYCSSLVKKESEITEGSLTQQVPSPIVVAALKYTGRVKSRRLLHL